MNLALWLQRTAQKYPDKTAVYLGRQGVATYSDLMIHANRLAAWLAQEGIGPSDRVAIYLPNTPEYLSLFYGIWQAGAVAVPINAKLHPKELSWIIDDAQAHVVVVSDESYEFVKGTIGRCTIVALSELRSQMKTETLEQFGVVERAPSDLAWLFYTSGTTGRPKGVQITHGMVKSMALSYFVDVADVSAEDSAIYAAPMSHGAGLYNIMHVLKGARHVFPTSGHFEPSEIFDLADYHDRAHMFAAPTMIKRLVEHAKSAGVGAHGLRTVVYGGGPMYLSDIVEAVEVLGNVFVQIYGQGECPMAISALSRDEVSDRKSPNWEARLASVGRAQSVVEVQIGTKKGERLSYGEVGEIMVRGDAVMPGYWNNPEATEKTILNGWLRTGDMGVMDQEGYITLKDRSKDMIISGGSNIYPREVEEVLLTHADVLEVSVIGKAHPEWGEDVVACVVCRAGAEVGEHDLDAHCRENIAAFKRPKHYLFLDSLPKNNYGKVLKTELRKLV